MYTQYKCTHPRTTLPHKLLIGALWPDFHLAATERAVSGLGAGRGRYTETFSGSVQATASALLLAEDALCVRSSFYVSAGLRQHGAKQLWMRPDCISNVCHVDCTAMLV